MRTVAKVNQMKQMQSQSLDLTGRAGSSWRLGLAFGVGLVLAGFLVPSPLVAAVPANDTCAGAITIPVTSFPYLTPVVTNVQEATLTGDPLPSCVEGAVRGVWYQITPSQSGIYSFSTGADTATVAFDTVISVFAAASCGNVTNQIACNDDAGGANNLSGLITPLNAGTHYYVLVWAGAAETNASTLAFQIKIDRPSPPNNDTCATAEVIPANLGFPRKSSVVDTVLATSDAVAPSCAEGFRTVWFKFTPATSGDYIFSTGLETATTVFDTVMTLYSGTCGGLTELTCAANGEGRGNILRALTAGTTYYIAVSDESSEPVLSETLVQLNVATPTAPSVTTLEPVSVSSTGVALGGIINPNGLQTRFWFEWGTSAFNRTSQVRLLFKSILPATTNIAVTGFLPNTTYQYRMVGTNQNGRTVGATKTFMWSTNGPVLNPLEILNSGNVRISFTGNPLQNYVVDTSLDLTNWVVLGPATESEPGSGVFSFAHPAAGGLPRRFYRVSIP